MVGIVDGHPNMMTGYDQNLGHDQMYEDVDSSGLNHDDAGEMTKEDLQDLLVFAQQQGYDRLKGRRPPFGNRKGPGAQRPRQFSPRPGVTRPGQMGAPQRDMKCVNCGRQGHAVAECRSPVVPVAERPCVKWGKKGQSSRNCTEQPSAPQARRVGMVDVSAERSFGCNLTREDDGWNKVIRSGARAAPRRPLPTIGDVMMASTQDSHGRGWLEEHRFRERHSFRT